MESATLATRGWLSGILMERFVARNVGGYYHHRSSPVSMNVSRTPWHRVSPTPPASLVVLSNARKCYCLAPITLFPSSHSTSTGHSRVVYGLMIGELPYISRLFSLRLAVLKFWCKRTCRKSAKYQGTRCQISISWKKKIKHQSIKSRNDADWSSHVIYAS